MRPGHRGPAASFCVIPARFERATRSLEGCCSIQLSYGTIGKYAAQRTICAAKIGKVFHNSPRQSKKSHIRHGGNMPSIRKRRIDRTSGNTPQKPRFPVPERHPRHNSPPVKTAGATAGNGSNRKRQEMDGTRAAKGWQAARSRRLQAKAAGSLKRNRKAPPSKTGRHPQAKPEGTPKQNRQRRRRHTGRAAARPRQCVPTCRKSAFRSYFSANYFAGRNILPTFAGLKAQSG